MDSGREVVVLSGVRTAIGDYGGALKDLAPTELAARVVREAVSRAKVAPEDVGHAVFGNVIHTEAKDMYLSRVACINGGLPKETPALTLNRLCGSGLQAIVSAAQTIMLGDADVALGGGAESMSRGGYLLPTARWGTRMGDAQMTDMMVGALTDPFDTVHMGITAENVADEMGDHAPAAGRAGAREQPPRGECDPERLFQGSDPADRDQVAQGPVIVRHRRTSARTTPRSSRSPS